MITPAGNKMCVLGLMSGTSLDGLDLAVCEFEFSGGKYDYKILDAQTVPYDADWTRKLSEVKNADAEHYFNLDALYGRYIAGEVNNFLASNQLKPALIASHGHTVFHQPSNGFSTQIGCGATITALTSIDTVNGFRSLDVALGGQGAPLVPIGDHFLFGDYDACLNIGGIANISFVNAEGKRLAYDICVANMLLNELAQQLNYPYDKGGMLARKGMVLQETLNVLNNLDYYKQDGAKSIGREWFEKNIGVLLKKEADPLDLLATSTEHIASVIGKEFEKNKIKNVLFSGGGTYNEFLIERIKSYSSATIVIPANRIIDFKEALIFAFLGYLRVTGKNNTLASVTGAKWDSCGGAVFVAGGI